MKEAGSIQWSISH